MYDRKVVQSPDAYWATFKGKIKEPRRPNAKPLTWLGFVRAGRSGRVPCFKFWQINSTVFSAPCPFHSLKDTWHEQWRARASSPHRAHSPNMRTEAKELHQPRAEGGKNRGSCRLTCERQWTACFWWSVERITRFAVPRRIIIVETFPKAVIAVTSMRA
jgi:hypothetical protein